MPQKNRKTEPGAGRDAEHPAPGVLYACCAIAKFDTKATSNTARLTLSCARSGIRQRSPLRP